MNMFDGNESSKSNSSIQMSGANHLNNLSEEAYAQLYHLNQISQNNLRIKSEETDRHHTSELTQKDFQHHNNMPSSSSSIISQESPATILSNSTTNETDEPTEPPSAKRCRTNSIIDNNNLHIEQLQRLHENHQKQILNNLSDNDEQNSINNEDDHSDHHQSSPPTVPTDFLYPFYHQNSTSSSSRARKQSEHLDGSPTAFPNPANFLHPFYQQATARQVRNSEQLLGELVTSELIKMTKDKKKIVQKKILEILFFDDE